MLNIDKKTFQLIQDLPIDTHNLFIDLYNQELGFNTISPQHYRLANLVKEGKASINTLLDDERVSVRVYLDKL